MQLGKNISASTDFSFEYFIKDGFIGCYCSKCSANILLDIEMFNLGKPVEKITNELDEIILNQLIKNKTINLKKDFTLGDLEVNKYILRHIDALYSVIICKSCSVKFIAIFGMGEIQPGREHVQFKGIWELKVI